MSSAIARNLPLPNTSENKEDSDKPRIRNHGKNIEKQTFMLYMRPAVILVFRGEEEERKESRLCRQRPVTFLIAVVMQL